MRTQVALIPLDALGELHDLRPLLELLDVYAPQADPAFLVTTAPTTQLPPGYHSLVAHLISGSVPVILPRVLALPDLIFAL